MSLHPGNTWQNICNRCYNQLENHDKEQEEAISDPDYGSKNADIDEFNKSLHFFGISPFRTHTNEDVKVRYGKRKLKSIAEKLSSSFNDLIEEEVSNDCDSCNCLATLTSDIKESWKCQIKERHFTF